MIKCGPYVFSEVIHSSNHVVYKGHNEHTNQECVGKFCAADLRDHTDLEKEFKFLTLLSHIPGVVGIIELYQNDHHVCLVTQNHGISITNYLNSLPQKRIMDLDLFLTLATQLSVTLGRIHAGNVMHNDVKAGNLLVDVTSKCLTLCDFNLSTVAHEANSVYERGTPAFMSPEQTGKTTHQLDFRSDLYSMGVVFYYMLSGELPFKGDSGALIHQHLAVEAPNLTKVLPEIPTQIGLIVAKLLAKHPGHRYQSAFAVTHDLDRCLESLRERAVVPTFPLAEKKNRSLLFTLPEEVYGRQAELETLDEKYQYMKERNVFQLICLSGASGVGKTTVLKEFLEKRLRGKLMMRGKFDQAWKDIPYNTIRSAVNNFASFLLQRSEAEIRKWADILSSKMAERLHVLTEFAPRFKQIVALAGLGDDGRQPHVAQQMKSSQPNTNTNNDHSAQYLTVVLDLLEIFASIDQPVTMILDDLQWADASSLELIKQIALANTNVLIVGTYRDNEMPDSHPFQKIIHQLKPRDIIPTIVQITPLSVECVKSICSFATWISIERASLISLANIIHSRTEGNPFYVRQLLHTMHIDNLITFDPARFEWVWDLDEVVRLKGHDSVVDMLLQRMEKLNSATKQVLYLASNIGHSFSVIVLQCIAKIPMADLTKLLEKVLTAGLLIKQSEDVMGFSHDRIQQAAEMLEKPDEITAENMKVDIGWALYDEHQGNLDEYLYTICSFLNNGLSYLGQTTKGKALFDLNMQAATKSRINMAFEPSLHYSSVCKQLLEDSAGNLDWETDYSMLMEIHNNMAECLYRLTRYEEAEELLRLILEKARSVHEKFDVLYQVMRTHWLMGRHQNTVDDCRKALALYEIEVPTDAKALERIVDQQVFEITNKIKAIDDEDDLEHALFSIPECKQTAVINAVKIMTDVAPIANISDQSYLFLFLTVHACGMCLEHGNTAHGVVAFSSLGFILASKYDYPDLGCRLTSAACVLADSRAEAHLQAPCHRYLSLTCIWAEPYATAINEIQLARQYAADANDVFFLAMTRLDELAMAFISGLPLPSVLQFFAKMIKFVLQVQDTLVATAMELVAVTVACCIEGEIDPDSMPEELAHTTLDLGDGEISYMEVLELPVFVQPLYACFRILLLMLKKRYDEALIWIELFDQHEAVCYGLPWYWSYCQYTTLCYIELLKNGGGLGKQKRDRIENEVDARIRQLNKWSQVMPQNFQAYTLMAKARRSSLSSDCSFTELLREHEQAANSASESGHIQLAALALELLGSMAEDQDVYVVAHQYYGLAAAHYAKWGARFKVIEMEEKCAELREMAPLTTEHGIKGSEPTGGGTSAVKKKPSAVGGDATSGGIQAIVNAAQALSRCSSFDELIQELLRILVTTAGATRCVLLTRTTDGYIMPAEGLMRDSSVYVQKCNHVIPTADEMGTMIDTTVGHEVKKFVCLKVIQLTLRTKDIQVIQNTSAADELVADWLLETDVPPKCLLAAPILNQGELKGVVYLENSVTTGVFTQSKLDVIDIIATQVSISIENIQSTEALLAQKEAFARFFPKEFLDLMGKSDVTKVDVNEGKTFYLSVLFSDIRNFTKLSEGMEATEVFKLLNDYHQKIAPICRKWGGFIDKFIGDAIMALFPRSPADGISAAVEMQLGLKDFNQNNAHRRPISIGVGVQYGTAMLGTVGESHRMEGTVIGDCVNTASRLEGLTKAFTAPVLTSGEAIKLAVEDPNWNKYPHRTIGEFALQGKSTPLEIIEVFAGEDSQAGKCDHATLSRAINFFKTRQFEECKAFFADVVGSHYNDTPIVRFYTSACNIYCAIQDQLPVDWPGTVWVDKDGEPKIPDGINFDQAGAAISNSPTQNTVSRRPSVFKTQGTLPQTVLPQRSNGSPSPNTSPLPFASVGSLTPTKAMLLRNRNLESPVFGGSPTSHAWETDVGVTDEAFSGRTTPFTPLSITASRPNTAPVTISDDALRAEFQAYDIHSNGWLSVDEMMTIYASFECYSVDSGVEGKSKLNKVLSSLGMEPSCRVSYDQFALIMLKLLQL